MYAMMTSMERRQTTDPRALALASAGRESRKVLKTQPMGEVSLRDPCLPPVPCLCPTRYASLGVMMKRWLQPQTRQGAGQTKEAQRMVFMNAQGDHEFQESLKGFANNRVRTAKYNVVTFLPLFLFEMFSRAAYFYFLCQVTSPPWKRILPRRHPIATYQVMTPCPPLQACLSWWEVISPLGGTGATAALLFVLGVSGIKAVAEDRKRHQEDRRTNVAVAHVMSPDGTRPFSSWQRELCPLIFLPEVEARAVRRDTRRPVAGCQGGRHPDGQRRRAHPGRPPMPACTHEGWGLLHQNYQPGRGVESQDPQVRRCLGNDAQTHCRAGPHCA